MEKMMKLPDDVFKHELLQYLTVYDIVVFDNSCLNHHFRNNLIINIQGAILIGNHDEDISKYFNWLIKKQIYIKKVYIKSNSLLLFTKYNNFLLFVQNLHIDNNNNNICRRNCKNYNLSLLNFICKNKCNINNNVVFNSNNWQALMSLQLMDCRKLTDKNIKSITKDCYSLINLTIANGINLTNESLQCIVNNKNKLQSFKLHYLPLISDLIIISILTNSYFTINCFILESCTKLTDNFIEYVSKNCKKIKFLEIINSSQLTFTPIIYMLNNSQTRTSFIIINCNCINDINIILLSNHCSLLKTFFLRYRNTIIEN